MTAAEPQPARLPLPGGREGATVRLQPLLTATVALPGPAVRRESGRLAKLHAGGFLVPRERWVRVPIPAFLVEHPGAGPLLVDTGFHASVASAPRESLGRLLPRVYRDIEMTAAQAVPDQLRALGVDPAAIRVVVMTHLHADHASGVQEFPQATFVVSAEEWQAASELGPMHGYVRRQFDHAFDWRTVDFHGPDAAGYGTFGRTLDLFGDGSVRLLATPGHSRGHLSVLLRLRERDALLCGDAVYTLDTLRDAHPPAILDDEHRWRRSLREIQLWLRERPGTLVVPGHDLAAFEALQPLYA